MIFTYLDKREGYRMPDIIDDNYYAKNKSFMYYLHEENSFNMKALNDFSVIEDLPADYLEHIDKLQENIEKYIKTGDKDGKCSKF